MPNNRLADRYAKSLIDLATERSQLDIVRADMQYFIALCKASKDFVNMLRSPIIKSDQKEKIVLAITTDNINELTAAFIVLLLKKGRESYLPEIANAFVQQYNAINDIHIVKLTTAVEVSEEMKQLIVSKVKIANNFKTIELETETNASLIGGFTLEFDNKLVDASIANDLRDIKKHFKENLFVHNLR
jgi:F-type H+-transporting ATPase subunit delta